MPSEKLLNELFKAEFDVLIGLQKQLLKLMRSVPDDNKSEFNDLISETIEHLERVKNLRHDIFNDAPEGK